MKILLGRMKEKGDDLAAFLEPRIGTKPSVSGDTIEVEDSALRKGVKPRHVKTYIKRFLYMNELRKEYRVFVAGTELTLQQQQLSEEEEEEKEKKEEGKKEEAEEKPSAEGPAKQEPQPPSEGEAKPAEEQAKPKESEAPAKKPRAKKTRPK
jgi:uncharacterized membrane protein